jgi:hypothetical protein
LEEENACILTMSSTKGDSWLGKQIKRDANKVYIDVDKTSFYCKSLDENRQLLTCIINADPHLSYVPAAMINMGLTRGCGGFLNILERKSQTLSPQYE